MAGVANRVSPMRPEVCTTKILISTPPRPGRLPSALAGALLVPAQEDAIAVLGVLQAEAARLDAHHAVLRIAQGAVGAVMVELDEKLSSAPDVAAGAQGREHFVLRAFDVELEHVAFFLSHAPEHLGERGRPYRQDLRARVFVGR